MTAKPYKPPVTITRAEFTTNGSDSDFRRSIYALVQCAGKLLACRDAFGRELSLTPTQFAVLMGVAHAQGDNGVTIRDLADHVGLASTHVTTEVSRLERAGLVGKKPSDTDRRSVLVSLLALGEAEITRVTPFIRRVNDALFRDVDAGALAVVHAVANRIVMNSELAAAELRLLDLERRAEAGSAGTRSPEAPPAADRSPVTTRAANDPNRAASRPAPRSGDPGSGRRGRAAAKPRSG